MCSCWWFIAPLSRSSWTRPESWKGSTSRWKAARERTTITTLVHITSLALHMMDTPSMEEVTMGAMTATTMEAMDIVMITIGAVTTATREDTLTTLEDTEDMTATVIAAL